MRNLQDLAQYELENTAFDYKAVQYHREKQSDPLKDIIAMANANVADIDEQSSNCLLRYSSESLRGSDGVAINQASNNLSAFGCS